MRNSDTEKLIPTMVRLRPAVRKRLVEAAREAHRALANEIAFRIDKTLKDDSSSASAA